MCRCPPRAKTCPGIDRPTIARRQTPRCPQIRLGTGPTTRRGTTRRSTTIGRPRCSTPSQRSTARSSLPLRPASAPWLTPWRRSRRRQRRRRRKWPSQRRRSSRRTTPATDPDDAFAPVLADVNPVGADAWHEPTAKAEYATDSQPIGQHSDDFWAQAPQSGSAALIPVEPSELAGSGVGPTPPAELFSRRAIALVFASCRARADGVRS